MTISGPHLSKLTYLANYVEVIGRVDSWNDLDQEVAGDGFALRVESGAWDHFFSAVPGADRDFHCETYPWVGAGGTLGNPNRVDPSLLPAKPAGQNFVVTLPDGMTRPLQIKDRVRVPGRMYIENGHPRNERIISVIQKVGQVFLELHPIDYTRITLYQDPPPTGETREFLAVIAPLYEEVFSGQWPGNGVAQGHLCIDEAVVPSHLVHDTISADYVVPAPPGGGGGEILPHYRETLFHNGTNQPLGSLRTVTKVPNGIRVQASLTVPADHAYSNGDIFNPITISIGDVDAPANDRGVLILRYEVAWHEFGHVFHTIRRAGGTWAPLGDVNGQFAIPGPVRAAAGASATPGEAQFIFATDDGHLWHTVRSDRDGSWSGLGDVLGQIQNPGPVHAVAAASSTPGEAQFLIVA